VVDFRTKKKFCFSRKLKKTKKFFSYCGFAINGEVINSFQYVKIRQHPYEYGTGTLLKSINNQEIFDQSVAIIKHFNYTGIFELEYILNGNSRYHVIEMNPRTWKSIDFATSCVQNLCLAYYNYMQSGIIPVPNHNFQVG